MVSAPRPRRWRRLPAALAFVLAAIAAATVHLAGQGPLVPGANVNMVRGTAFVGGDPFLQRQNEPSLAISTRNPCHLLAGANDYRTVDFPDPTPLPNEEGVTQAPAQNPRDAWLGVYTSTDCGSTWRSALLPGHPFDTSAVGLASPNRGFTSAADPVVRAGTNGLFFYAGLVFDRADNSRSQVFVSRFIDNNNRERGETIEYIDASVVDVGDPDTFVDKPWVAVDQPRAGALLCDINGQRFPAGRVYVAWARFEGGGSRIMLSRSADCGRTWQAQALSDTAVTNQGASIAIAPHDGTVHVAWRQFARENLPATIQIATSRNGGATFTRATVASPINAFDQAKLENRRFRTNSLPTVAADHLNRVYVAWSERGYARASGRTNPQTGDTRIVLAVSGNGGQTFAPRYPIDDTLTDADGAPRFGHQVMPSLTFTAGKLQAIYYDFSDDVANVFNEFVDEADTPPVDPNNPNLRRRHTVDVRAASAEPAAQPLFLPVLVTPQGTSPRLSHYRTIVDPDGTVRQVQFNPPNLPLFVGGTIPFIGDYIDVAGLGFVPYQGGWRHNNGNTSGPRFDGAFPSTPAFHAVWTDHRDVRAPADGDWTLYKAPGDPFWKMPGSECVPDRAGMRNANIYTARITNGLYAGSPGNTKPLGFQRHPQTGAVIVDPTTGRPVHMQRSFVVFVQNSLQVPKKYLMRIVNQPGAASGDRASFLRAPQPPFSAADLATRPYIWLVATVQPLSTISRTVFVTSANERAMVRVDVLEVAPTVPQSVGNLATTAPAPIANGRRATVLLNPDPTNPTILDPDFVSPDVPVLAKETHDPEIFDPVVTTIGDVRSNSIELRNPDEANPDEANPDEANIDEETPDEANPDEANPDEANPDEANPDEANPDEANAALRNTALSDEQLTTAHVVDVQWKVKNNGNTTTSFRFSPTFSGARIGKHFQLLVTKRYYVPAVDGITCELGVRRNNQVIVNVPGFDPLNPDEANPDEANPDEANPDEANPDEANPDEANPDEANATFFLAPGETATATLRVYDLTTAQEPPPAVLATFEETASAVVESQAPNTGEAVPPRDVAGADLVPINALVSPANAAPGTNAQISWTLANRGTEPTDAASFSTRFMFSTDREISENDTQLAVVTFSGTVPPDDPSTPTVNEGELPQTTTVTIPPGATTGPRFILLVTDSLNEVPEADEANNAAAAELVGAQALAFVGQPTNTTQGFRFATPVSVAIVPIAGVPPTVAFVNLAVASGPVGATLSGTLTAPNVAGVATFTDLTLSTPGTYTLLATGTGIEGLPVFAAPAISAPFTVAVDAPPVAVPDSYAVAAGGILTISSESESRVTANDTDAIRSGPGIAPPGRALLASLVQTTQFGTLTFNAFGGFVYQPVSGFNGVDFFTYRLNDGVAFGNTTTVRIAVGTGEGNAAPVTRPLSITVAEDSVNTAIDVVAAAIDADGDALTILGASAFNGTATVSGGVLRYSPDQDYSGSDTIDYVISDGRGGNTPGVVTVTVTPVNDNPVATNDGPFTVPVNAPATGFPVLVNDNDGPDSGETLTVVRVGAASHGSVIFSAAEVRYTPHREYTGPDTFSYEISDGHGGSASALVTVNVGVVNQTPDAEDDAFETTEDVAIASFNVVANDTDADAGDVLAITAVTQPANGLVTFTPGPGADTVRYEPRANFNGIDTFTYTVSDGRGGSDTATVTVTVTPVNDAPVAVDDQAATLRDTSIDIDVLANDIDVDKCFGCTSIQRGGEFIFFSSDRPATGSGFFHLWAARPDGSDLVQLTTGNVIDSGVRLRNDGRTLAFTRSVGDVSQIWTLDLVTGQAELLFGAPSVPGNPLFPTWSPDGNSLAFVVNEGTDHDIWVTPYPLVADGFRRVTPDDGQTRTFPSWASNDTVLFQIYVTGDSGSSIRAVDVITGTETVIIPSRGGEWYPTLSPDGSKLMWNSERHSTNGDIFVAPYRGAALIPDAEHRRVTSASGYNFMAWAPDGHRIVAETFPVARELMVMNADGTGLRALESSPLPAHDPWWAVVARAPLPAGSEATPLQIVALPTVEHGGALLLPSGRVRFTPEPGYVGMASFTYSVSDGEASDTATVSVAVIAINAPPVATDDSVDTPEDTPRNIDVAVNDTDPDGDPLAIDAFGTGQHGAVEHDTAQPTVLRYVPHGNFNGSDSFTYTIRDGHGHTNTATVHVTVTSVNDEPVFVAALPDRAVQEGAPDTMIDLSEFVTDVDVETNGEVLTYSVSQNTNTEVVSATIDGTILTLDYGRSGTSTVNITVEDGHDGSATDGFLVTVDSTSPVVAPAARLAILHDFHSDAPYTGGTAPHTLSLIGGTLPRGLSIVGDSITGEPLETGEFEITLRVTDVRGRTDDGTLTLEVGAVDQEFDVEEAGGSTQVLSATRRLAQTFTAGADGYLRAVGVSNLVCTSSSATVRVWPVSGSGVATPDENGTPLAVSTGPPEVFEQVLVFRFAGRPFFRANERYAVVIETTGACEIRNIFDDRDSYILGHAFESTGGGPWQRITGIPDLPLATGILPVGLQYLTNGFIDDSRVTYLGEGDVLVTGYFNADILNTNTGIAQPTNRMAFGRFTHTATRLDDGRVLIAGGAQFEDDDSRSYPTQSEVYSAGQFQLSGAMNEGREGHTATKLADGRVVIIGGRRFTPTTTTTLTSIQIFNPATNTFSSGGALPFGRADHTATLLVCPVSNPGCAWGGTILVNGGTRLGGTAALIYNPTALTSTATTGNPVVSRGNGHSATLLADGRVLLVGASTPTVAVAEIYDPATGGFAAVAGPSLLARYSHTATRLSDGDVLIAGGTLWEQFELGPRTDMFRFDVETMTFAGAGTLHVKRGFYHSTLLPDGRVLLVGGMGNGHIFIGPSSDVSRRSVEYYDPNTAAVVIATTTLPNGVPLVAYPTTTLIATGGVGPYTFQVVAGTLPPGLVFENGTISGTVSGTASGWYPFTVEVRDSSPTPLVGAQTLEIRVTGNLQITTATLPSGSIGVAYSAQLQATGGFPPYRWSLTPGQRLPGNLTLNSDGSVTGVPNAVETFNARIRVEDASGQFAWRNVSLAIAGPLQITTTSLSPPALHDTVNVTLSRIGGQAPFTWSLETGSLPPGLTLSAAGVLSGASFVAGAFPIEVRVTDGGGSTDVQTLALDVFARDQILSTSTGPIQTFGPARRIAQTLTVGASGALAAIRLNSLFCNAGSTATIEVRPVTGSNVALPDETAAVLSTGSAIAAATVALSPQVPLSVGDRIAVVFTTPGGCEIRSTITSTTTYAMGHALESSGGGAWQRIANAQDLPIETRILPANVSYLTTSYFSHRSAPLTNGEILVVGASSVADIFTPSTGAARRTISGPPFFRPGMSATTLNDGSVLITGGSGSPTYPLQSMRYVATGGGPWFGAGSLAQGRSSHTATKLFDGRVVIAGGENPSAPNGNLSSIEIYTPATDTFTSGGSMLNARDEHHAILLPNGRILFAGGDGPISVEIYSPATQTSAAAGQTLTFRQRGTATLLPDGRVLFIGGTSSLPSAEIYDPGTSTSQAVSNSPLLLRFNHTASLMPDGTVLVAGGLLTDAAGNFEERADVLRFNPSTMTVTGAGSLQVLRRFATARDLPDGRLLLIGDVGASNLAGRSAEYFDPSPSANFAIATVVLPDGQRNVAYQTTNLEAAGGTAPFTFQIVSGSLPPGLTFVNGTISGTPTGAAGGRYTFVFEAAESSPALRRARATLTITIDGAQVTTTSLPNGAIGQPYAAQLSATGVAPLLWSLQFGTLPAGLTLGSNGAITGTPTTAQFAGFGARVDDAVGQVATRSLFINIVAAPAPLQITTTTIRDPIASEGFSWQVQTSGGSGPITFVLESGALPLGLSLTGAGNITGTALETGDFDILVRATDGQGSTDTQPLSLHVGAFDVQRFATSPPQDAPIAGDSIAQTMTVGATGSLYAIRLDATCTAGSSFAVSLQGLEAQGRPDGAVLMSDGPSPVPLELANQTPKLPWEVFVLPGRKFFTIGSRVAVVFSSGAGCSIRKTTEVGGGDSFRRSGFGWQALDPDPMSLVVGTVIDSETDFAFGSWFSNDGTATHLTCPAGGCSYPEQVLLIGNTRALQLYNPATHRTTVTPNFLDRFFSEHTATRLADGRVLIAGGWQRLPSESSSTVSSASFIFDPATQTVSPTGSMLEVRSDHEAVLLRDGRVLVVGGLGPPAPDVRHGILNTEVFDPATGTWTLTAPMADTRWDHTLTRLECPVTEPTCSWGGRVLVFGGFTDTWPVLNAEFFNPLTNTFVAVPGGEQNRSRAHHATAQLMNGFVLATGGQGVGFAGVLDSTDVYDPASGPAGTISRGPALGGPRMAHTATLVGDGTIIVAGGVRGDDGEPTESIERFHQSGSFIGAGSMGTVRREHTAMRLLDGRLVFAGGWSSWNRLGAVSLETFDSTGQFAIATTTLPDAHLAEPYDASIDTFGGELPIEMQIIDGALPPGLALQSNSGAFTLHGIPSMAGLFEFTARSTSTGEIAYQRLSILVRESLNVSQSSLGATVGTPYDEQLSAFGGTGTAWTWAFEPGFGAMPPGITLTTDGRLVGTPAAGGNFSWMVRVTDNATPQQTVIRRIRLSVSAADREQPVVDPEYGVAHVSNVNMLRVAQTIIAGRSGRLTTVRLRAYCTAGHLTVSVYDTTSTAPFVPTSQVTVDGFQGDTSPPAAWREITFSQPPYLRAGEAYAIAVNSFNGACAVELGPGTSYTGGSLYVNDWAGPESWSPWTGPPGDFAFATLVEPLDISAFGSPTVDGRHTVDEWSNASRVNVVMRAGDGLRVPATMFFQNDLQNLYMSIVYDRRTFDAYTSTDLYFDGDNDTDAYEAGEDILHFNSSPSGFPWFGDNHQSHANCAPNTCWELDEQHGGTSDGSSRQTYSGETFTVEMQHPISSGDRFDLGAVLGQTLGIRINHLIWEPNDAQFVQFPEWFDSPATWRLAAPADTCVLTPPGLVSWWTGEHTVGEVEDVHGINDALVFGTIDQTAGRFGSAFSFNGAGRLQVPDAASLSPHVAAGGELTVEAWVNMPTPTASSKTIIGKVENATTREYALSILGSTVRFDLWRAGANPQLHATVAGTITPGNWHHVVGTFRNGRSARLYVDGVLVAESTALVGVVGDSTAPLTIGGASTESPTFVGIIDEPAIFRREMTPDDVRSLHANGKCRPPSQKYTLQVIAAGHGTVTSGVAINCGGDCVESYPAGAVVVLTPTPHAFGGVTFTGFSGDCTGLTCTVTMTRDMTVRATFTTNYQPWANFQSVSTSQGTPLPVTLTGGDPEGQPITFSIVSPPEHGTLSVITGNQVTYTPDPGFAGSDFFQFDTFDGYFRSTPAFVFVTVTPGPGGLGSWRLDISNGAGGVRRSMNPSLVANPDGTYVVARDVEFPVGGGAADAVVTKVSAAGVPVWTVRLTGTGGGATLPRLIRLASGAYVYTSGAAFGPTGGPFEFAVVVVKISEAGVVEWQRALTVPNPNQLLPSAIAEDLSGDLYVVGTNHTEFPAPSVIWIAKLNSIGELMWQQSIAGSTNAQGAGIAIVNGSPVITGTAFGAIFVLRLTPGGTKIAYTTFTIPGPGAAGRAITATSDGGYAVAGTSSNRPLILKFGLDHALQWTRLFQTGTWSVASIAQSFDGRLIMSGKTNAFQGTPSRGWIGGFETDGTVGFQREYASITNNSDAQVAVTADGGLLIAGYNSSVQENIVIIKTDGVGASGCGVGTVGTSTSVITGTNIVARTDVPAAFTSVLSNPNLVQNPAVAIVTTTCSP